MNNFFDKYKLEETNRRRDPILSANTVCFHWGILNSFNILTLHVRSRVEWTAECQCEDAYDLCSPLTNLFYQMYLALDMIRLEISIYSRDTCFFLKDYGIGSTINKHSFVWKKNVRSGYYSFDRTQSQSKIILESFLKIKISLHQS